MFPTTQVQGTLGSVAPSREGDTSSFVINATPKPEAGIHSLQVSGVVSKEVAEQLAAGEYTVTFYQTGTEVKPAAAENNALVEEAARVTSMSQPDTARTPRTRATDR